MYLRRPPDLRLYHESLGHLVVLRPGVSRHIPPCRLNSNGSCLPRAYRSSNRKDLTRQVVIERGIPFALHTD